MFAGVVAMICCEETVRLHRGWLPAVIFGVMGVALLVLAPLWLKFKHANPDKFLSGTRNSRLALGALVALVVLGIIAFMLLDGK
jgi:ABC-type phosphate transport system permease subunit